LSEFTVLPLTLDGLALLAGDVVYQNSLVLNSTGPAPVPASSAGNLTDENEIALNVTKEEMNR
jgi:hypothetical protein